MQHATVFFCVTIAELADILKYLFALPMCLTIVILFQTYVSKRTQTFTQRFMQRLNGKCGPMILKGATRNKILKLFLSHITYNKIS